MKCILENSNRNSSIAIDFVVTWVDQSDQIWLAEKNKYLDRESDNPWLNWTTGEKRFRDWGFLPFWFRGIEKYAPWVRDIYFVTAGHVPEWLDLSNEKLHVVRHDEFIPHEYLPTFNSNTIELNLHRIKGLSEQFVYFNDDCYLTNPTNSQLFFKNGLPRDFASLSVGRLNRERTVYYAYSAMIINDHFDFRSTMRSNIFKWLSPKNGLKNNIKTLTLLPQLRFPGFSSDHLPMSFLKSTFNEVWDVEGKELDKVCKDKFRQFYGISPLMMRDWQRVQGNFINRKFDYGMAFVAPKFFNNGSHVDLVRRAIEGHKYKVVCINDEIDDDVQYELWGAKIRTSFMMKFPNKSSFEK